MTPMDPSMEHFLEAAPLYRLNEAATRLQEEHIVLEAELLELYGIAKAVCHSRENANWSDVIAKLRDQTAAFMKKLHSHSNWEEHELFPLVETYLDEAPGSLQEIEQEHELAEQYIEAFFDAAGRLLPPVRRHDAVETASFLLQAYGILAGHFKKEEEILFAIADRSNPYGF